MRLLDPKAPLIFATVAIIGLVAFMTVKHPSPGRLSRAHGQIGGLEVFSGCRECHGEQGLSSGCLGCHEEIAGQLSSLTGYHAHILEGKEPSCAPCHPEHLGEGFQLVSALSWSGHDPKEFDHSHVQYGLTGKHGGLPCEKCHAREGRPGAPGPGSFALARFPDMHRAGTFLGLRQDCRICHEDIHAGGLSGPCEECHGQDSFKPAVRFDHSKFFPLAGAHEKTPCTGCHTCPPRGPEGGATLLPFDKVRGKACIDCHASPHRAPWGSDCVKCHPSTAASWSQGAAQVTPEIHALAGFALAVPHDKVECGKCHKPGLPYAERFPDPRSGRVRRTEEACEGCHGDPHQGQFAARQKDCLGCHDKSRFVPSRFTAKDHTAYPLEEAHAKVECGKCHRSDDQGVTRFAGIGRDCASCHKDPHGGQFAARQPDCRGCHNLDRFVPARFSLKDHGVYPLEGAHAAVACGLCHKVDNTTAIRQFAGTTRACKDCHRDPHGGQFQREMAQGDCDACHARGASTFTIRPYDHAARTGYTLVGAHAKAGCADCHKPIRQEPPSAPAVLGFRKTPARCDSCHRDIHRGQFREEGINPCERCHGPESPWKPARFDHNRQSSFALDGVHVKLACGSCHPQVKLPGNESLVQYKPIGRECKDCHGFDKR